MHGITHDYCPWQPGKNPTSKDVWSCETDKTAIPMCQGILYKYFGCEMFYKQPLFQNPNKFSMQRNTKLEVRTEQTNKDRWIYNHEAHIQPYEALYQPVQLRVQENIEGTLKEVLCPFTYLYNLQQPHTHTCTKTTLPINWFSVGPHQKPKTRTKFNQVTHETGFFPLKYHQVASEIFFGSWQVPELSSSLSSMLNDW